MKIKNIFGILLLLTFLTSCKKESPHEIVEKTVLNANLLMASYGSQYFQQLEALERSGNLMYLSKNGEMQPATYSQYLKKVSIPEIENIIAEVEALQVDEDSKPLIDSSLDLFKLCLDFYETDYPKIVLMYDENKPRKKIIDKVRKFEEEHYQVFEEKNAKLDEEAKKYAENNGIKLKFV